MRRSMNSRKVDLELPLYSLKLLRNLYVSPRSRTYKDPQAWLARMLNRPWRSERKDSSRFRSNSDGISIRIRSPSKVG